MVKLKGPAYSLDGTGSVADVMALAKSKRGTYAKKHAAPANPKTKPQMSVRALMSFLAQQWRELTTAEQATWADLAEARGVAPYHEFVAHNHHRWTTNRTPTKEYPATESSTPPKANNLIGTPGVQCANLKFLLQVPWPTWGYVLYRSIVPSYTAQRTDAIAMIECRVPGHTYYRDTPLPAGTYYYRHRGFNDDGLQGALWSQVTVVVP